MKTLIIGLLLIVSVPAALAVGNQQKSQPEIKNQMVLLDQAGNLIKTSTLWSTQIDCEMWIYNNNQHYAPNHYSCVGAQ